MPQSASYAALCPIELVIRRIRATLKTKIYCKLLQKVLVAAMRAIYCNDNKTNTTFLKHLQQLSSTSA